MAQQLDLQEQEQLDALKAFWNQYGNLITWVLTIGLGVFAGYEIYLRIAQKQATAAGTLYAEIDKAATDGDAVKAGRVFDDMQKNYGHPLGISFLPVPTYTQQAGLLAAKAQSDKGQDEASAKSLQWVVDNGSDQYAALARLRLAGVLADQKKYDDALAQLAKVTLPAFSALAADRKGDILIAKGDTAGAKAAYQAAWSGMDAKTQYRFVVETKLVALGAAPAASAASGAAQ
jgi:predicted negative regulator of RcsB-dependent stress response